MNNVGNVLLCLAILCAHAANFCQSDSINSNKTVIKAQTEVIESQSRVILDLVERVDNLDHSELKPTDEMADDLSVIRKSSKGKKDEGK